MHRVEEGEGAVAGQRDLMLTGGAKNALVAVQRYYSNNVTDYERQQVRCQRRSERLGSKSEPSVQTLSGRP